ncbi:MAG TPA: hypothetical protein VGF48_07435 [Thermoanaerobaculia bacterium]|jgi:hypothetical protein
MKRMALAFSLMIALAPAAWATDLLIPAVFRGDGAEGTKWRTGLVIANTMVTAGPTPVTVRLFRPGVAPAIKTFDLARRATFTSHDVLPELFGVNDGGGMLMISFPAGPGRVTARARVYNVSAAGEYGQSIRGIVVDDLRPEYDLIGLSNANGNRTNLGIANPYAFPLVIWLSMSDGSGGEVGFLAVEVPPLSVRQINDIFAAFLADGTIDGAHVHVTSPVGVYAYASVVRADTGDATFVDPQ